MKTKIMQSVGLLIAIISFTITNTFAQDSSGGGRGGGSAVASHRLPIGSQDELRNYGLGKVVRGSRYVQSQSLDWNYADSITYANVTGNGAEDVLDKLFASELKYRLINPDDLIKGYVYLYDKDDNLVFFGYAEFTVASMKVSKPSYNIWMQNIPMLENVESAEVLALDENGKTARRYNINVNQYGHLLFEQWMAGAPNGILVVRFKDGLLARYDLSNPNAEVPGNTLESASWKIEGHYVYGKAEKPVIKIIEPWVRPTAIITVAANQVITIDVLGLVQMNGGTEFERPVSVIFEQVDGPWAGAGNMNQSEPSKAVLPAAGKYRLRFEWKNFGQPNTLYTGPEYDDDDE